MCAPKIEAAPVAGQALLPEKTLRRKVSLAKHHVRWANLCQGKANELTDVLKAPDPTNLCLRCRFFLKYAFIVDWKKSADESRCELLQGLGWLEELGTWTWEFKRV
jgi:hypothetical protein